MKKKLLFLVFFLAILQSGMAQTKEQLDEFKASSTLFQSKYYKANVWDVQRSPANASAGVLWTLGGFKAPYDAITGTSINWGTSNDRYLQFDLVLASAVNNTVTKSYTDDIWSSGNRFNIILRLYESNGTFVKDLCSYGSFMGFGDKGFLFAENNHYGTFFANDSYVTGGSVQYTPTTGVLTMLSELKDYKYSPQLVQPTVSTTTFTYNGTPQGLSIPANAAYTVSGASATDVNNYTATITLKDKVKYTWADGTTDDVTIAWSIIKGTYNMTTAKWDYTAPFTYDANPKSVTLIGLPAGVTVQSYAGNSATNAGTYTASATLTYNAANYNDPTPIAPLTWEISKAMVNMPTVTTTAFTYNSNPQGISIPENTAYTISGVASATNAGSYTSTVVLKDKANYQWNDGTTGDISINWNIAKASYDMSSTKWNYTTPIPFDGTQKTVAVTGLPSGVTVKSYLGNTATTVGIYTASATFAYDEVNYNEPTIASLSWEIEKTFTNLSIIKLWNNVLAVSNGDKYEEIRNATFRWYRNGTLLSGSLQYLRFDGAIPAGEYKVEITTKDGFTITVTFTVAAAAAVKAYPNPLMAGTTLTIETGEERSANEQVQVYNLLGTPVRAAVNRETNGYRISGLNASGTYLIRIAKPGETPTSIKVIVK